MLGWLDCGKSPAMLGDTQIWWERGIVCLMMPNEPIQCSSFKRTTGWSAVSAVQVIMYGELVRNWWVWSAFLSAYNMVQLF